LACRLEQPQAAYSPFLTSSKNDKGYQKFIDVNWERLYIGASLLGGNELPGGGLLEAEKNNG